MYSGHQNIKFRCILNSVNSWKWRQNSWSVDISIRIEKEWCREDSGRGYSPYWQLLLGLKVWMENVVLVWNFCVCLQGELLQCVYTGGFLGLELLSNSLSSYNSYLKLLYGWWMTTSQLIHECKKKCLSSTGKIMVGIGSHWELSFTT